MKAPHLQIRRDAFTLVELLVAILVVSALISIVFIGARAVMKNARITADRQTVLSMKTAVEQFRQEFGFLPPMVQDVSVSGLNRTWGTGASAQSVTQFPIQQETSTRLNRLVTYSFALADRAGGQNPERDYLRGYLGGGPLDPNDSDGSVDYNQQPVAGGRADRRFSTLSLPTYINAMGEAPLDPSKTGAGDKVIDGVSGPEMFAPRDDGTFAGGGATTTTAKKYGAFMDGGRRGLNATPFLDQTGKSTGLFEFRDRNGRAIRYYRWLRGKESTPSDTIGGLSDLAKNVPSILHAMHPNDFPTMSDPLNPSGVALKLMAARADYDLKSNSELKTADFAIVSAGPDGTFGDAGTEGGAEGIAKNLSSGYGRDISLLKIEARSDNVVGVGR